MPQPGERIRVVDRERPGYESRVEAARDRRAYVDHHRVLVLVHQLAQFIHCDARHAKHLVEAPPLPPFEGDVGSEERGYDGDRREAEILQPRQELRDLRVKDDSRGERDPGPERGAHAVPEEEAGPGEVHRARERGADGGQAGKEFRHREHEPAPALEVDLGLAHARIGRERDPAKQPHDAVAIEAPRDEPGSVADHAGEQRHRKHRPRGELSVHRERSGDDEGRHRRQRQPELLGQHVDENQREAVVRDEGNEFVHEAAQV